MLRGCLGRVGSRFHDKIQTKLLPAVLFPKDLLLLLPSPLLLWCLNFRLSRPGLSVSYTSD